MQLWKFLNDYRVEKNFHICIQSTRKLQLSIFSNALKKRLGSTIPGC